ncbi:MAG: GntR family transcriptional regulator [Hydrogenophaga sp.]
MSAPNSTAFDFSAIVPARAADEISAQVREMIASGRLRPGDRLPSERELSARMQVSRNTLREALRALEHAGIIEMRKGATGGAFVRSGSSGAIVNGLRDLYHLGAITPQQLTEARVWLRIYP